MHIKLTDEGHIADMTLTETPHWSRVLFCQNDFAGPAWVVAGQAVPMRRRAPGESFFEGELDNLTFGLEYRLRPGGLTIHASIRNAGRRTRTNLDAGIRVGIDSYMDTYPQWNEKLFPTMLRCEKTHFWGYFMGPAGQIMLISVPQPVASYQIHYKPQLHRIYTATLNLLHPPPLPARHPENQHALHAGETRTWEIALTPLSSLDQVKPAAAISIDAPMIDLDLYTIAIGETFEGRIFGGESPLNALTLQAADAPATPVPFKKEQDGVYSFACPAFEAPGSATMRASSENGKHSEARLAVRHPWSWYLKKARENAVTKPQKASSHTESWYGLFSAYLARRYFPDAPLDAAIDAQFHEIWPLMYDPQSGRPTAKQARIQNHACGAGMFADKYQASGDVRDLESAAQLADYILETQGEDGAYYSIHKRKTGELHKTHYTSVIYIAKSLMEVIEQEQKRGETDPQWRIRAQRHLASVQRAIDELERKRDDIQTEGEMTYEDGMIACSYSQLAMYALYHAQAQERQRYLDAAIHLVQGHRCLSQLLVPDCRMNGGSLRFWESQYDILSFPNKMTSPHGWSAWRIYGLWYLYQLTGEETYLRQVYNALGACCQLIACDTGELRWGFVVDPYIEADYWEEHPESPGRGRAVPKVVGEQYLPMISGWYKAAPSTWMHAYGRNQDGGACDNDVHEIFKCLEETALTSAYVVERNRGQFVGYNCTVVCEDDTLVVTPEDPVVDAVHFKLLSKRPAAIAFAGRDVLQQLLAPGMSWVSTTPRRT